MEKKNFEELFNNIKKNEEIIKAWELANNERKKRNRVLLILLSIIDISMAVIILKRFQLELIPFTIALVFIINIFVGMIVSIMFRKKQREYTKIFKNEIIKPLINNFYNNLEYFPEKKMPQGIYNEANYNEFYNRYYSDDYLEAKIDNMYDISMAEVETQKVETDTDSNGNTTTTTTTIFHGLFAKILINKSIQSNLRIGTSGSKKERLEMDSRRI